MCTDVPKEGENRMRKREIRGREYSVKIAFRLAHGIPYPWDPSRTDSDCFVDIRGAGLHATGHSITFAIKPAQSPLAQEGRQRTFPEKAVLALLIRHDSEFYTPPPIVAKKIIGRSTFL